MTRAEEEKRCEHGFVISMQLCVACFGQETARDLQKVKPPQMFRCSRCHALKRRKELTQEARVCIGGCAEL